MSVPTLKGAGLRFRRPLVYWSKQNQTSDPVPACAPIISDLVSRGVDRDVAVSVMAGALSALMDETCTLWVLDLDGLAEEDGNHIEASLNQHLVNFFDF